MSVNQFQKLSSDNTLYLSEKIKEDGFVIIKNLYSKNILDEARRRLDSFFDSNAKWVGVPQRDVNDKRIYNLVAKDKFFIDFIFNENLLSIMHLFIQDPYYRWLPEGFYNFILNSSSARSSGGALDLHIDSGIPFTGETPLGIVVIASIERSTIENGATFAIKGTHQSGSFTDRSREDFEILNLDPGDVILMDSRVWHGAGKNHINKSRWTINSHFTQWFIKQDIDLPRTINKELFEALSDQEKILLGFSSMPSPDPTVRVNIKTGLDHLTSQEILDLFKTEK